MKRYCQFLKMSTGYVEGSIPPIFSEEEKYPIDALGTDGVFVLDARKSLFNQVVDIELRAAQLENVQHFIGFKIIESVNNRYGGQIIYQDWF
jgi:hypothetical protein